MKKTLDEYIKVYNSAFTQFDCDFILSEYENSNEWNSSLIYNETGNVENNENIRNCNFITISDSNIIEKNLNVRKQIDLLIFERINTTIKYYIEEFPFCTVDKDSGYSLLQYKKGGFFKNHIDYIEKDFREISCSIILNNDYEGGEFSFFDREVIIPASRGSVIIFPSNFMFPHEILPVTKGTRYSIVTWFV